MLRLSFISALFLGACGGAGGDDTIDITHDACAPLTLTASDPTEVQSRAMAGAIELWRGRGAPSLQPPQSDALSLAHAIEVRFQEAAPMFFGLYDDENAVIYINQRITDPGALEIVIAHELGHAFGLEHVTGRASLMNPGNHVQPPTAEDQAALAALWGPCSDRDRVH